MFGFKNKNSRHSPPLLILTDADGRELYHDRLDAFPFPDEMVIAGSIEFFRDPAPCEIHRRAVQLRFCGEITQSVPFNRTLKAEEMPKFMYDYFCDMKPAFIRVENRQEEEDNDSQF